MKLFIGIIIWLVLFLLFPLLALAALVLLPIVWVIALPLRLLGIVVNAAVEFVKAVLLLPARLLGARPSSRFA